MPRKVGSKPKQKRYMAGWRRNQREKARLKTGLDLACCRICHRKFLFLGSHVIQRHGITARDYKIRFKLPLNKGLSAPTMLEFNRQNNAYNKLYSNITGTPPKSVRQEPQNETVDN